jgi:hypothetical protein
MPPYRQPPPSPIEISFWDTAHPLIPELQKEVWIDHKYRVDFLIPSKKIVIELYGFQYHNTKEKLTKDAERERYLQRVGYQVIRFTGTEIYKDVRKCVDEVITLAKVSTPQAIMPVKNEKSKNPPPRRKHIWGMKKWQVAVLGGMIMTFLCLSVGSVWWFFTFL